MNFKFIRLIEAFEASVKRTLVLNIGIMNLLVELELFNIRKGRITDITTTILQTSTMCLDQMNTETVERVKHFRTDKTCGRIRVTMAFEMAFHETIGEEDFQTNHTLMFVTCSGFMIVHCFWCLELDETNRTRIFGRQSFVWITVVVVVVSCLFI